MMNQMKSLIMEEEGQAMTEYGLILGLVAVAVVAILVLLRDEIISIFQGVVSSVQGSEDSASFGNLKDQ
ncbi:Flp family type IVb pilin [Paenibacillus abyssi]|uniref:Pilin n=1 Tax=Paenibacillus abyssi TaxID=1340531 RepID=A0A917FTR7_9BACL|nr:Flp family type IVb pilin [Paenibacillus abyssi]GGG00592.1 hypothetical protein GCM10010916_17180 [Paenibacillus abyssi]